MASKVWALDFVFGLVFRAWVVWAQGSEVFALLPSASLQWLPGASCFFNFVFFMAPRIRFG